jgi:hypothetical protein
VENNTTTTKKETETETKEFPLYLVLSLAIQEELYDFTIDEVLLLIDHMTPGQYLWESGLASYAFDVIKPQLRRQIPGFARLRGPRRGASRKAYLDRKEKQFGKMIAVVRPAIVPERDAWNRKH